MADRAETTTVAARRRDGDGGGHVEDGRDGGVWVGPLAGCLRARPQSCREEWMGMWTRAGDRVRAGART